MGWREEWEKQAEETYNELDKLSEAELLEIVKKNRSDFFFTIWDVIEKKSSLEKAGLILWKFLKDNPGEELNLPRYHCAGALFSLLGMPDPDSENELRCRVQWAHKGEEKRQEALEELRKLILKKIKSS
jgi:hypothetical protein